LKNLIVKKISLENIDDVLNLIKRIYNLDYLEKEFYDKNVIEHYITKINYEKGGAWKGIFLKGELIAQMLAIIEHKHVILKLTMIEDKYRNLGLMKLLSISMIREIDLYKGSDFKTIFAFVDPINLPILKILHQFDFIRVGSVPAYDVGEDFLIYSKTVFNYALTAITPHHRLIKKIEEILRKSRIERKILDNKSLSSILINNFPGILKIVEVSNKFPKKYNIYFKNNICAEFFENIYTYSWYDVDFNKQIKLELKDKILKEIVSKFQLAQNITSLSIIVEVNDSSIQEILLNLKFEFYGFLPLYYGKTDGLLLGISKIR